MRTHSGGVYDAYDVSGPLNFLIEMARQIRGVSLWGSEGTCMFTHTFYLFSFIVDLYFILLNDFVSLLKP